MKGIKQIVVCLLVIHAGVRAAGKEENKGEVAQQEVEKISRDLDTAIKLGDVEKVKKIVATKPSKEVIAHTIAYADNNNPFLSDLYSSQVFQSATPKLSMIIPLMLLPSSTDVVEFNREKEEIERHSREMEESFAESGLKYSKVDIYAHATAAPEKDVLEARKILLEYMNSLDPKLIDVQNSDGDTALMIVARRLMPLFIEQLLRSGANTNVQNNKGYTALHIAIWGTIKMVTKDLEGIIKMLLAHGADPSLKDHYGRDAYATLADSLIDEDQATIQKFKGMVKTEHEKFLNKVKETKGASKQQ